MSVSINTHRDNQHGGTMKSMDSRDYTPEPPAILDPLWVISMRSRLAEYVTTGNLNWYRDGIKCATIY